MLLCVTPLVIVIVIVIVIVVIAIVCNPPCAGGCRGGRRWRDRSGQPTPSLYTITYNPQCSYATSSLHTTTITTFLQLNYNPLASDMIFVTSVTSVV